MSDAEKLECVQDLKARLL